MKIKNLKIIAEELKQLACKECTRGWISKHEMLTDPIEEITLCFENNLISLKLKDRLVSEVREIQSCD